jgi:hypothetical protein
LNEVQAAQINTLMFQLEQFEQVTLPASLTVAADQLLRLPSLRPAPELPSELLGLTDDEIRDTMRNFGVAHALDGSHGPGAVAYESMGRALAAAIAAELCVLADDILDQLRARFDEAARVVHQATALGLHGGTSERDILKADNVEELRDAWTAVPAATRMLDTIAASRILLSSAAGVPPAPRFGLRPGETINEYASAMFRTDGRPWREEWEQTWQMWLRLCTGSPAQLLSVEQAIQAARVAV